FVARIGVVALTLLALQAVPANAALPGRWVVTGSMVVERSALAAAALLEDGRVLVAGGTFGLDANTAELYDPSSGTWAATGSMPFARSDLTATLLPDGQVLVAGGYDQNSAILRSAELYDSATGTWHLTGRMLSKRFAHTAILLPDGTVLVAGGGTAGQ